MEQYTIYCTEEQTKKALELGAPIEPETPSTLIDTPCAFCGDGMYVIPTAEQMAGWLEEKGLCIEPYRTACGYLCTISKVPTGSQIYSQKYEGDDKDSGQFTTRCKATLAAIDAALDFLKIRS